MHGVQCPVKERGYTVILFAVLTIYNLGNDIEYENYKQTYVDIVSETKKNDILL